MSLIQIQGTGIENHKKKVGADIKFKGVRLYCHRECRNSKTLRGSRTREAEAEDGRGIAIIQDKQE